MEIIKSIKRIQLIVLIAMIGLTSATFTSCRKKGCTDTNANNYYDKAKKDDGTCTYPVINVSGTGKSGDLNGAGGSASRTFTFTNNNTTVGWDMTINNATSGSFQLVIQDASGAVVVDKTLTAGSGPQSASATSLSGAAGTWTATVTLTKFNGTGDYSFQ